MDIPSFATQVEVPPSKLLLDQLISFYSQESLTPRDYFAFVEELKAQGLVIFQNHYSAGFKKIDLANSTIIISTHPFTPNSLRFEISGNDWVPGVFRHGAFLSDERPLHRIEKPITGLTHIQSGLGGWIRPEKDGTNFILNNLLEQLNKNSQFDFLIYPGGRSREIEYPDLSKSEPFNYFSSGIFYILHSLIESGKTNINIVFADQGNPISNGTTLTVNTYFLGNFPITKISEFKNPEDFLNFYLEYIASNRRSLFSQV